MSEILGKDLAGKADAIEHNEPHIIFVPTDDFSVLGVLLQSITYLQDFVGLQKEGGDRIGTPARAAQLSLRHLLIILKFINHQA